MATTPLDLVGIEKVASLDYLETVMRCYREGRVAVPIDPGSEPPAGIVLAERITPAPGGGWFGVAQAPLDDDRPAHVAFSSGTTGTPKAVLLSHRALADVTRRLVAAMGIDGEIREYLGVPPTYSFGLGRARVAAAVGGRVYIPERGFDPGELARMLEAGEVNALSAVPTLLRVLIANPELISRKAARKLRWLEIGSQYMSAEEKAAVRRMFPGATILQHYGLTEASRTTFLDVGEATQEQLETVGRPAGETEVRIDGESRICIRGPHVADGVLTADGLVPLTDSDGWLVTNDVGSIDADGYLSFLGRTDHLINVGGIKVSAELFEQRLIDRMGGDGAGIAVAARADAMRGQTVMVAHLPDVAAVPLAEIVREVASGFGLRAADVSLVQIEAIPRTDTGKVQRGTLAERHGAEASSPPPQPSPVVTEDGGGGDEPQTEREREIAAIWHEALGISAIGRNESFFDIGGDSLSAITVMLRMERAGIPKAVTQQIFEGSTIAQIAARLEPAEAGAAPVAAPTRTLRAMTTDAVSLTRAALVIIVLTNHWSPFILERMGALGDAIWTVGVPLFRMGTPGFAIVFGLGLGYFQMPVARQYPERLRGWMRNSTIIVAGSVALLAVLRGIDAWLGGRLVGQWPTDLFFGVLTYYLAIALTAGLWLRMIARTPYPVVAALLTGVCAYGISLLFRSWWATLPPHGNGLINLGRLMLATRYSYPEMLGHTMMGMSLGLWIEGANDRPDLSRITRWVGAVLLPAGVLISFATGQAHQWLSNTASLPQIIAYAGAVLLIFSTAFVFTRRPHRTALGRGAMRLGIVIGVLAFPIYVAHEAVMPAKDILAELGLSAGLALLVPLALFFAGLAFAIRRVHRLYYG